MDMSFLQHHQNEEKTNDKNNKDLPLHVLEEAEGHEATKLCHERTKQL